MLAHGKTAMRVLVRVDGAEVPDNQVTRLPVIVVATVEYAVRHRGVLYRLFIREVDIMRALFDAVGVGVVVDILTSRTSPAQRFDRNDEAFARSTSGKPMAVASLRTSGAEPVPLPVAVEVVDG